MQLLKSYKHIFFDLDHTLWDFEKNSQETLRELFAEFELQRLGVPSFDHFFEKYKIRNEFLWKCYREGKISVTDLRLHRFSNTLSDFFISDKKIAFDISHKYMAVCPDKSHLVPNTIDTLQYLQSKYELHIITNGFHEVQMRKIKNCKIGHYFGQVITSESAGCLKPEKKIFEYALALTNAKKDASVYVGDSLEVDILGAKNAGLDQIFFNPRNIPHTEQITYEVQLLTELKNIL